MQFMGVNLLAVLIAAIATMILGFLWYSPLLFAKPWMELMGYDPNDLAKMEAMRKNAGPLYAISFVASLVTASILSRVITASSTHTVAHAVLIGAGIWLGFVTTVQLTDKLFTKKPLKLYLINTGYQLVCYIAMAAIIAAWPK